MTTTKEFSWAEMVKEAEGDAFYEKPVVYDFEHRQFREEDPHGPYEEVPN